MKWLQTVCLVIFSLSLTAQVSGAQPSRAVIDCFEERTFHYTGGKYQNAKIKYRLHTPETIQFGRRYPLIVHLHGLGEAGSDNTRSLLYLGAVLHLMTGQKRQDFFLLVAQCPRDTPGWSFRPTEDGTLDVLMAAIEHVIAENPIDKNQITATGVSSGGRGVWELILKYPDMFAGAVPTSCSAPQQLQRLATLKQTPVWAFVNKEDRQIDVESLRKAKQVINSSGGSMVFTEANVPSHNAWTPAMRDYDSFRWMLAQRRGSWFSPPPGVVVIHKPHSLLLVFVLYILPVTIIVFLLLLLRDTISEWLDTVWQSVRERTG